MQDSIFNYLALGAALLALLASLVAMRKANALHIRSSLLYAVGAMLAGICFVGAMLLDRSELVAAGAAGALLATAIGLLVQSDESELLSSLTREQRVDHISGLPNERLFHERLAAEHSRTKRTNQHYSIGVFEIDNFASLSDEDKTNGMKLLAAALQASIRNTDTLGRIGSHQVAVLLVDTLSEGAAIGCERACERFFFQSCGHNESVHVTRPLTVSVGIASFDGNTVDPRDVVEHAQLALGRMRDETDTGIKVWDAGEFKQPSRPSAAAGLGS